MEDVIRIPLADGTNIIEVPVDELPDDVSDVLDLLKAEAVDLATYHRFGEAYYRRANYKAFRQLMLQGIAVITDVANKSKYVVVVRGRRCGCTHVCNPICDLRPLRSAIYNGLRDRARSPPRALRLPPHPPLPPTQGTSKTQSHGRTKSNCTWR
jgi:hypothetical protein